MSYIFLVPAPPLAFSVFLTSATRKPSRRRSHRRRHRHCTALAGRAHCANCSPPPRRHRLHPRTFRAAAACTCTPSAPPPPLPSPPRRRVLHCTATMLPLTRHRHSAAYVPPPARHRAVATAALCRPRTTVTAPHPCDRDGS
jgi:hypothetical protein